MGVNIIRAQAGHMPAAHAPSLGRPPAETGAVTTQHVRPIPEPEKGQTQRVEQKVLHVAESQRSGTRMRFDEASKRVITQIVDQNNEVIKQIPPEEMLRIAARFNELRGKLFDESV